MAFLFTGVSAIAQDAKHADPRYLELDEHPTFKGGGPNNFASWVSTRVKYPKDAKRSALPTFFIIFVFKEITIMYMKKLSNTLLKAIAVGLVALVW